jgi:calreticulin
MIASLFVFSFFALFSATTYFSDDFSGSNLNSWVQSTSRSEGERGSIGLSAGNWVTDKASETGLKTLDDARFYTYSKSFPEFSNAGKDLVLQYSVKHEQSIDCGGAYLKLHPAGLDQTAYTGDSVYNIMFGPDICGGTKRTHFILNNKDKNHLIKNDIQCESDTFTHTYTLILKPDNTFKVLIDGEEKRSGNIEDEFEILEPKKINDPDQSKPADWVDDPQMDDPDDKKPDGYDDIPATIVDPEAKKPEDWDDELDGEWEAPTISNPAFKGPWRAKRIDNPAYKGPWVHPQIDNPKYASNDKLYQYNSFGAVGIEVWQVKAGTIFDNILVTDSVEEAATARAKYASRKDTEAALEKVEREAKEAEQKAQAEKEAAEKGTEEAEEKDDL